MGVLKVKVNGVWEEAVPYPTPEPPLDEVWIGQESPDPAGTYELWYDTNTEPGVLKAKRPNGVWEPVGTPDEVWVSPDEPVDTKLELWVDTDDDVGLSSDEIWVGPEDPDVVDPNTVREMWYDTDEVAPPGASLNVTWWDATVPYLAGANVAWPQADPQIWSAARDTVIGEEPGVVADAWTLLAALNGPYLPLTGGTVSGPLAVNDQLTMGAGDKIQFQSETGQKINLYGTTFGVAIESGTLVLFTPAGNKVAFRTGSSAGAENASIGADGFIAAKRVSIAGYLLSTTGGGIYADSANGTANHAWDVFRCRVQDAKPLWKLAVHQGDYYTGGWEGRYEMWAGNGWEPTRRAHWTSFTAEINSYFDGTVSGSQIFVRSDPASTREVVTELDATVVGAAIDALRPVTFRRPPPPSTSDKPAEPPKIEVGFNLDDVAATGIAGLTAGDGDESGYSVSGLLAVAVAEIKSLRARVAQLEGGV